MLDEAVNKILEEYRPDAVLPAAPEEADNFFYGSTYVRKDSPAGRSIERFYEELRRAEGIQWSARHLRQTAKTDEDVQRAENYRREHAFEISQLAFLQSANEWLRNRRRQLDDIYAAPNDRISREEKLRLKREYGLMMSEHVRNVIARYDEARRAYEQDLAQEALDNH
jgi:hypothetical protein